MLGRGDPERRHGGVRSRRGPRGYNPGTGGRGLPVVGSVRVHDLDSLLCEVVRGAGPNNPSAYDDDRMRTSLP
jgi:hypothetical protein